jgi:hypothetical protein
MSNFPSEHLPDTLGDQNGSTTTESSASALTSTVSTNSQESSSTTYTSALSKIAQTNAVQSETGPAPTLTSSMGTSSYTLAAHELKTSGNASSEYLAPVSSAQDMSSRSNSALVAGSVVFSVVFAGGFPFLVMKGTLGRKHKALSGSD